MKLLKTLLTGLLIIIALLLTSCTALKNGCSEKYRKSSLQGHLIIKDVEFHQSRFRYYAITEPSKMNVSWKEWYQVFNCNDTVLITPSLRAKLNFK